MSAKTAPTPLDVVRVALLAKREKRLAEIGARRRGQPGNRFRESARRDIRTYFSRLETVLLGGLGPSFAVWRDVADLCAEQGFYWDAIDRRVLSGREAWEAEQLRILRAQTLPGWAEREDRAALEARAVELDALLEQG